jgi:choline dehydrogenase-like flavoprotein
MSNFDHLQQILSLAIDETKWENRIRLIKGKPVIDYEISNETLRSLENSALASAKLFFSAGAEKVHLPFAPFVISSAKEIPEFSRPGEKLRLKRGQASIASAHLMGGCSMGMDEKNSVTDEWGRVHGTKGLYVADASLFPSALEVNPYLTVMALADRVAEAVRFDLGGF